MIPKEEPYESPWRIVRVLEATLDAFLFASSYYQCPFCGSLFFCSAQDMKQQWGAEEIPNVATFRCRVCKQLVAYNLAHKTWAANPDERPPMGPLEAVEGNLI